MNQIFTSLSFIITLVTTTLAYATTIPPEDISKLSCSANGTDIIYINGVLTSKKDSEITTRDIQNILKENGVKDKIDSKLTVRISSAWNQSLGLGNDALELVAQELKTKGVAEPWKYIKMMQLGGLSQSKSNFAFAGLNALTYALVEKSVISKLYSVDDLQKAEELLSSNIQNNIKGKLQKNEKVIIIAHSQGNTVANSATLNLPSDIDGENKKLKYMGALHVATPSSRRAAIKSRMIKLSNDLVVSNPIVGAISESPNYTLQNTSIFFFSNWFDDLFYLVFKGSDLINHGMSEVYLSSQMLAHEIGQSNDVTMKEIFKKNLFEVAVMLEDNCRNLDIQFTSSDASLSTQDSTWIVHSSYDGNGTLNFKAKDLEDKDLPKTTRFFWSTLNVDAMLANGDPNTPIFNTEEEYLEADVVKIPAPDLRLNSYNPYQMIKVRAVNKFEKTSIKTIKVVFPDILPDVILESPAFLSYVPSLSSTTDIDSLEVATIGKVINVAIKDLNDLTQKTKFITKYTNYDLNLRWITGAQDVTTSASFLLNIDAAFGYYVSVEATNVFGRVVNKSFRIHVPLPAPLPKISLTFTCQDNVPHKYHLTITDTSDSWRGWISGSLPNDTGNLTAETNRVSVPGYFLQEGDMVGTKVQLELQNFTGYFSRTIYPAQCSP